MPCGEKGNIMAAPSTMTFSLVQFQRKNRGIAPISLDFKSNPDGSLRTADYMAEREGFEPSVQVLARTTV
jgi:hypothetical protein